LFDKNKKSVAFPFGFGLSYTTFQYSNLTVLTPTVASQNGTLKVSVEVTNTGKVAGEEVAQLYIGFSNSKIDRPLKSLKGFQKILLQPNETKTVSFEVSTDDLAYYDIENKTWKTELMQYEIFAGKSSDERDLLKGSFVIE
jgi:beta-glucosidase